MILMSGLKGISKMLDKALVDGQKENNSAIVLVSVQNARDLLGEIITEMNVEPKPSQQLGNGAEIEPDPALSAEGNKNKADVLAEEF